MPEHDPAIEAASVVVPVHNEEELLGHCLRALSTSVSTLEERYPHVRVHTVVVLDDCTDRSSQIAERFDVEVVALGARTVGVARAAGISRAVLRAGTTRPERHWLACTDADSAVPASWLIDQIAAAEAGARLVLGRVRPDPRDLTTSQLRAWRRSVDAIGDVGPRDVSVHGANLGVRLDAYQAAGGFQPLPEHEDVTLVRALTSLGVAAWPGPPVLTSGRTTGRTPGGFAGYLRQLSESGA